MDPIRRIPLWKQAPFLRILVPMIVGVLLQFYFNAPITWIIISTVLCAAFSIGYLFFRPHIQHRLIITQGLAIHLIVIGFTMLLYHNKDIRTNSDWYGNHITDNAAFVLTLQEPLVEKPNTLKTEALVQQVIASGDTRNTSGNVLLYFTKGTKADSLKYGSTILIKKPLQAIKNSGNPGAFNYKQYAAFQNIFHTVFLKDDEWALLPQKHTSPFYSLILNSRSYVLNTIRQYIEPNEVGVAEALLIGYKEHLDRDLVQAYSNTGVVHIIAISGLHLGLIYFLLVWLAERTPFIKKSKWLKVLLILGSLWFFAFLTGIPASVLRSAVMFSCIAFGKYFFRKASIYNSLSASACLLLAYNPYLLFDVGFQLSYAAIVGIIWWQPYFAKLIYIPKLNYKNPLHWPQWLLRQGWNLITASMAAQIFVLPLALYYFHQFPVVFLFTNLVAVPLSTLILYAEILLIAFSFVPIIATWIGFAITKGIQALDYTVKYFDAFSFSLIDNITAPLPTTILLYFFIIAVGVAFTQKNKKALWAALASLAVFLGVHSYYQQQSANQQKIVVYNVSGKRAVDFISGNEYFYFGDSALSQKGWLQNFHLKPSRLFFQATEITDSIHGLNISLPYVGFRGKKMIVIDSSLYLPPLEQKVKVDLALVTGNPKIKMEYIHQALEPTVVLFDGTNSLWKIEQWKKDCAALHLRSYAVTENGAFVLEVP